MEKRHAFTIIVPCYNAIETIEKCIHSIIVQDGDFEIIVIDDGSSDGSSEKIDLFAIEYSNIRVIHQDNGGVSLARNTGLDIALGKWILFCDADDSFHPDALNSLSKCLKTDRECDAAIFGYTTLDDSYDEFLSSWTDINVERCRDIPFVVWRMVFRKDIIDEHFLRFTPGIRYAEDQEFLLNYLLYCKNLRYIPNAYYIYTPGIDSAMAKLTGDSTLKGIQDHLMVVKNLCEKTSSVYGECPEWLKTRLHGLIKAAIMILYRSKEKNRAIPALQEGLTKLLDNYPVYLDCRQLQFAASHPIIYLMALKLYFLYHR